LESKTTRERPTFEEIDEAEEDAVAEVLLRGVDVVLLVLVMIAFSF